LVKRGENRHVAVKFSTYLPVFPDGTSSNAESFNNSAFLSSLWRNIQ
jgi:hypothetical protein